MTIINLVIVVLVVVFATLYQLQNQFPSYKQLKSVHYI
jgi:hypothetical protein